MTAPIYEIVSGDLRRKGIRFWSNDNIADYISDEEREMLEQETASAFEKVLKTLIIDVETDPNAMGTAKRLSKMYWREIFEGRYTEEPTCTEFPNEDAEAYDGMLFVRADIKSVCSHHHKDVIGVAYIGIILDKSALGLSKYIRLARWHARRGTLQEELTRRIAEAVAEKAKSENVGVHIVATHGCVSCRGVEQDNSSTRTTYLKGAFRNDPSVKKEFFDNIALEEK